MDVPDSSSGRLTSNMFTANISQDSSTIKKKKTVEFLLRTKEQFLLGKENGQLTIYTPAYLCKYHAYLPHLVSTYQTAKHLGTMQGQAFSSSVSGLGRQTGR